LRNIIVHTILVLWLLTSCNPKQRKIDTWNSRIPEFSAQDYSKNLELNLSVDWMGKTNLLNYDVRYIQLNFKKFIQSVEAPKKIEEYVDSDKEYVLDDGDKSRLIDFISESSNFSNGECGTFALNAGFVFLNNQEVQGIIRLGCGYYQWDFQPDSNNTLDGSLSEVGFNRMEFLLDEINLKMK